ncbi:hypothetical protein L1O03_10330 [Corynebacterium uropygiale]|uniref:Uncharacterized protein n=1 Tax=Corynebacterium uropygiale TaxID=1775911 RepID=A0A9X1QRS6_9CORY|nr:hypothetical protein [Corynebacterium uropygiale]MCF4007561.1 hypothetical protein [Corynebacterium uropygiale]
MLSVVGVLVILAAIALGWWAASGDSFSEKSDSSAAAGGAGQESSSPEYVDIYRDRLPTCDKGQDPSGGACTAPGLNQLPPGVEEVAQGLMIHDLTCLSPVDGDCKAIPDAFVKAAADAAESMTQGDPMPQELDLVAETSSGTEEFSCKWGTFSAEPQHKKTQWECRAHDRSAQIWFDGHPLMYALKSSKKVVPPYEQLTPMDPDWMERALEAQKSR